MPTINAVDPLSRQVATVEGVTQGSETPSAEAAAPSKEVQLSPKLLALAKKEKAIWAKNKALMEKEAKLKAQEELMQSSFIPRDRITKEPLNVLQELGIGYDKLTEMSLEQPQVDPAIRELQSRIEQLQSKLEASEKRMIEEETTAYDQAINQLKRDAKLLVDSDPKKYKYIKAFNKEEAIAHVIALTHEKTGALMTVDEAAEQIENYLIEDAKKIMALAKLDIPQEIAPQPQAIKQAKPQLKTLTQAVSTTTRRLTDSERRQRAILRAQGIDPDAQQTT